MNSCHKKPARSLYRTVKTVRSYFEPLRRGTRVKEQIDRTATAIAASGTRCAIKSRQTSTTQQTVIAQSITLNGEITAALPDIYASTSEGIFN